MKINEIERTIDSESFLRGEIEILEIEKMSKDVKWKSAFKKRRRVEFIFPIAPIPTVVVKFGKENIFILMTYS